MTNPGERTECRVLTWNLWWPNPSSDRASRIMDAITAAGPDVVVETETNIGLRSGASQSGHMALGGEDWGYETSPGGERSPCGRGPNGGRRHGRGSRDAPGSVRGGDHRHPASVRCMIESYV